MIKLLSFAAFLLFVLLMFLWRSYRRSIQGVWIQEEPDGWVEILVEQKGPRIHARSYVSTGYYEFKGLWNGKTAFLKRRDFGQEFLESKGFPPAIAKKVEGTVTAKLNLSLRGPDQLTGFFYPQKIQWDESQTLIRLREFLDPKWRYWYRMDSDAAEELIARKRQEAEEQSPSE